MGSVYNQSAGIKILRDCEAVDSNISGSFCNNTVDRTRNQNMPSDMQFNESHLISIVGYSLIFVFSAIGEILYLLSWRMDVYFRNIFNDVQSI
jgi:hypothetical protein